MRILTVFQGFCPVGFVKLGEPRGNGKRRTLSNGGDVAVDLVLLSHVLVVLVVRRAQPLSLGRAATAATSIELPVAVRRPAVSAHRAITHSASVRNAH